MCCRSPCGRSVATYDMHTSSPAAISRAATKLTACVSPTEMRALGSQLWLKKLASHGSRQETSRPCDMRSSKALSCAAPSSCAYRASGSRSSSVPALATPAAAKASRSCACSASTCGIASGSRLAWQSAIAFSHAAGGAPVLWMPVSSLESSWATSSGNFRCCSRWMVSSEARSTRSRNRSPALSSAHAALQWCIPRGATPRQCWQYCTSAGADFTTLAMGVHSMRLEPAASTRWATTLRPRPATVL
eukprot:scaffold51781_cov59-Phaeocystis_antarctica.AAC.3